MTNELHPGEVLTTETVGRPAGHCDDDASWAMFAKQYDGQPRTRPDLTDFALANAVFMADRNSIDLIVYQTAAKERIRWLSLRLAEALSASDEGRGSLPAAPTVPTEGEAEGAGLDPDAEALARAFHETYEHLAPSFGYETRSDTKAFDPKSANGRLMIAVCASIRALTHPQEAASVPGEGREPVAWEKAADGLCAEMLKQAPAQVRKVSEALYETLLDSVQDYLRENVAFNLSADLARANRKADEAFSAFKTVAEAIGVETKGGPNYPTPTMIAEACLLRLNATHPAREDGPAGQWQDGAVAALVKAADDLQDVFARDGECSMERFERLAEMFRKDTGYLAPGKDAPMGSCQPDGPELRRIYDDWFSAKVNRARAALAAFAAPTKEPA